MKKPSAIQPSIPHPCTQKWDKMTPNDTGRFCAHCQKTVIDFTTWSDTALYDFFAKNTGRVCGRMYDTQFNRNIAIPYQPHSRLYRLTITMGLTLLVAQTPHLMAQNRPPLVAQSDSSKLIKTVSDPFGTLTGAVQGKKKANNNTKLNFVEKKPIILIDGEIRTTRNKTPSNEPLNPSRKVYKGEEIDRMPH